jgi:hypothetical protein
MKHLIDDGDRRYVMVKRNQSSREGKKGGKSIVMSKGCKEAKKFAQVCSTSKMTTKLGTLVEM